MITLERWKNLSKRDQLGHIASEIYRAKELKEEDGATRTKMLERALELVDLSLRDEKWAGRIRMLLCIRNALAESYIGRGDLDRLYAAF